MTKPRATANRSQWRPGESGNKAGRPKGTGEVAKLRAGIAAHVPDLFKTLIDKA